MKLCTLVLILFAVCMISMLCFNRYEKFNGGYNSLTHLYNRHRESPYQIGKDYYPMYNWPEYTPRDPYYRYFFSPYNSAVYYN